MLTPVKRKFVSSPQELSGSSQYAFGSLCACGDLFTCTAEHMHKSGKSPLPAAAVAAAAAAAVAVMATAVAVVVVVMAAVVAVAAGAAAAAAVGIVVTMIRHIAHHVKGMHICLTIAVDKDAEQDGIHNLCMFCTLVYATKVG